MLKTVFSEVFSSISSIKILKKKYVYAAPYNLLKWKKKQN